MMENKGRTDYVFDLTHICDNNRAFDQISIIYGLMEQKREEVILEELEKLGFDRGFIWNHAKDFRRIVAKKINFESITYKAVPVLEIKWKLSWSDDFDRLENQRRLMLEFRTQTYEAASRRSFLEDKE